MDRRGRALLAAIGLALATPVAAAAAAPDDGDQPGGPVAPAPGSLAALWQLVDSELAAASAALAPPPTPPTPVAVTWKARRVASLDLGAALLALAVGDLDGDGRGELVALTERAIVVLSPARRGLVERARIAVPAAPASIRPRDPVGALSILAGDHGGEIWARSSAAGLAARYRLVDGALQEVGSEAGFPFCPGEATELAPGRNYAAGVGPPFLNRRCRADAVDATGRRVHAQATVGVDGALTLVIETRCPAGGPACPPTRTITVDGAGVAVEVDDVDRDGRLELITSAAGAPGDADAVVVRRLGPTGLVPRPLFKRSFSGGIAALGSGDVDGDGDRDVFAAVRLAGARKVDLWLLD